MNQGFYVLPPWHNQTKWLVLGPRLPIKDFSTPTIQVASHCVHSCPTIGTIRPLPHPKTKNAAAEKVPNTYVVCIFYWPETGIIPWSDMHALLRQKLEPHGLKPLSFPIRRFVHSLVKKLEPNGLKLRSFLNQRQLEPNGLALFSLLIQYSYSPALNIGTKLLEHFVGLFR